MLIKLDGEPIEAEPGDTVAAALLRKGITTFTRSIKYHRPRGPFCFTGSCGQCLMRVDGVPSVHACRAPVREGQRCERQNAPLGSADRDLLRAVDFIFPGGLDHHHIVTFSKTAGQIAMRVARSLAGLGHLPDQAAPPVPARVREAKVAIVGAGPAGLGAAATAGQGAVVLERDDLPGGAALLDLDLGSPRPAVVNDLANAARDAAADLWLRSECVGLYSDDGKPLLAVRGPEGLTVLRAERVVIACGGFPQPLPFPGVDRPGVYAARGLISLARRHGVLVGTRRDAPPPAKPKLAIAGEGAELAACATALRIAGYDVVAAVEGATVNRVRGNPVRELQAAGERIACDAVAIALPPAPIHELAVSAGAPATFDAAAGGFVVASDPSGRTAVSWLFVAGRVAGRAGAAAVASGRAAGEAARG